MLLLKAEFAPILLAQGRVESIYDPVVIWLISSPGAQSLKKLKGD